MRANYSVCVWKPTSSLHVYLSCPSLPTSPSEQLCNEQRRFLGCRRLTHCGHADVASLYIHPAALRRLCRLERNIDNCVKTGHSTLLVKDETIYPEFAFSTAMLQYWCLSRALVPIVSVFRWSVCKSRLSHRSIQWYFTSIGLRAVRKTD